MAVVVAGFAIVVTAFYVETATMGECWRRHNYKNKYIKQFQHGVTLHAKGENSMRISVLMMFNYGAFSR